MARIGVEFELAIVAAEIGSYKPALGHWRAFEREVGKLPDVHVAASLFHDVAPAKELRLRTVWINRLGEEADPEDEVLDGRARGDGQGDGQALAMDVHVPLAPAIVEEAHGRDLHLA